MYRVDNALQGVMIETAKTSSLVFIILIGAAMLTAAFRGFGGEDLVRDFLTNLPGGFWTQFIIVMAVIFLLGFFLDFIEIAVVVVPIVAPILLMDPEANVTAVWLGVMIGLNIQTSFLSPPFGFALFYLRGVASSAVKTIQIYKGVVPFIALQLVGLAIVGFIPALVNYVPLRISLTSETAPPPVNPRLQFCIEEYVFNAFDTQDDTLRQAIAEARSVPLGSVPTRLQKDLGQSFDKADSVFDLLAEVRAAHAAVEERTPAYKPLHTEVRALQARIGRDQGRIATLQTELGRLQASEEDRREEMAAEVAALEAEVADLTKQIPADWEERHTAFKALLDAEQAARRKYRQTVDQAYQSLAAATLLIRTTDDLVALQSEFETLRQAVEAQDPAIEALGTALASRLNDADADDEITSQLSKMRREARGDTPDWAKVESFFQTALAAYEEEVAWREAMASEAGDGLLAYEVQIRDTIGLRQQTELPTDVALYIASCEADHRDISLYF